MRSPAPELVFVSHGGADHPLALALRARLRSAGFDAYVYDSRLFRPPAYVEPLETATRIWADIDTFGGRVNISHLCPHIEAAAYVVLLGGAENVGQIDSWHTQGEIAYAQWLGRIGPRSPAIVALPTNLARMLVLESDAEHLRKSLAIVGRGGRPRVTFARLNIAIAVALSALVVTAVAVATWRYALLCGAVALGGIAAIWLGRRVTQGFSRFARAAYLGEVNASSAAATMLFGHRTRQLHGSEAAEDVKDAVRQDIFVATSAPFRRAMLRIIFATPSVILFGLLPLVVVVALLSIAYAIR